jgi:segregation and condensation protein A
VATFKIRIPDFEGPLDLLLFFIKRDELDIYDIPISHITKEFLSYVHVMQMLDLELAGEFIVMAATLMQIKARMLLPRTETEEGEEENDPRAELTQRLLEYKRYKEAALEMQDRELDQRQRFFRTYFKQDVRVAVVEEDENVLKDVTFFDLIKAFQKAMASIPKKVVHEVRQIPWSIEEQGVYIMRHFQARRAFNFIELARSLQDRMQLVVTFIALLELIRAQRVTVEMHAEFNDFTITKTEDDGAVDGAGA